MGKCEECGKPTEYKSNVLCDKCFDNGVKDGSIELGENPPEMRGLPKKRETRNDHILKKEYLPKWLKNIFRRSKK